MRLPCGNIAATPPYPLPGSGTRAKVANKHRRPKPQTAATPPLPEKFFV